MNGSDFGAFLVIGSMILVPILAHNKGRRWWAWLLPSLFLGPFMLIPVLLVKKVAETTVVPEDQQFFVPKTNDTPPLEIQSHQYSKQSVPLPDVLVEPESDEGFVYVISNPSITEDLIKIGFTKRDPSERIKELDQAGLPTEYIEHYRIYTKDARQLEIRLHEHFAAQRYRKDKEFFRLSPHEVYAVLKSWGVKSLEL